MSALTTLLRRLGREHFPGSRFIEPSAGRAVVDDPLGRLSSAFQPIVEAAGHVTAGHHAFLRAADKRGRTLGPMELFASIHDGRAVERLDRLARALHMVNYFPELHGRSRLFVAVDARLVGLAPVAHRDCFDALLTSLDVPTSRVVVCLPESALDDPVTFVRSTLSYRIRGYQVLATLRLPDAHADMDHVFMADPDYAAIDASNLWGAMGRDRLRRVVEPLHQRGIRTLAQRVETADQAAFAREVGISLLQGQYLAAVETRTDGTCELDGPVTYRDPRSARRTR